MIFFEVVQTVFIPVAIPIRSVGGVECIGRRQDVALIVPCHTRVGIAIFESIRHSVAVRIPIRGAVEQSITVHVHHEPTSVDTKEGPGAFIGLDFWFVTVFTHALEEVECAIGHFDDVVDEVHVGIPSRGIGAKRLLFEVCEAVVIRIQNHVTGVAAIGGKIVPISHAVLTIESTFESIFHGLIKQQTIPVAVKRVEQNNFATGRLHGHGVQRFPTVVQSVVVGVSTLRVSSEFLFRLVGEAVTIGVARGSLAWIRPRFSLVFGLGVFRFFALSGVDIKIFGFTIIQRIEAMLNLPTIAHSVVIRIWIVDVCPVLGLFEFVGEAIAVGVERLTHQFRFATKILFNSALKSTNIFTRLEEA